ncbi:MAG: phosphodiesterase [Anaerorhabdus sp.]
MKYLVVGDIHGSLNAAKKIEALMRTKQYDACLILGDILYHGPRNPILDDYNPKQVIEILNSFKSEIIAVRGNCDSEVDQMVLNFPILSSSNQFYLNNHKVLLMHGHLNDFEYRSILKQNDIVITGHTHLYEACIIDGIYHFNAGSLSLPKNGNVATYAELTFDSYKIKDYSDNTIKEIDIK